MGKSLVLTTSIPALNGGKIKVRTKDDLTHNIMLGNESYVKKNLELNRVEEIEYEKRLRKDLEDMYSRGLLNWNTVLKDTVDIIAFDTDKLEKKNKDGILKQGTSFKFNQGDINAVYEFYLYAGKSGAVLGIKFSNFTPEYEDLEGLLSSYKYAQNGYISSEWFDSIKSLMDNVRNNLLSFIQDDKTKLFIKSRCTGERDENKLREAYYPSDLRDLVFSGGRLVEENLVYEIKKNGEGENIVIIYPNRDILIRYCTSIGQNPGLDAFRKCISNLTPAGTMFINKELKGKQVNSIEEYYKTGRMV